MDADFQRGFFAAVDCLDSWILQQKNNFIGKIEFQKQLKDISEFYLNLYSEKYNLYRKNKELEEV